MCFHASPAEREITSPFTQNALWVVHLSALSLGALQHLFLPRSSGIARSGSYMKTRFSTEANGFPPLSLQPPCRSISTCSGALLSSSASFCCSHFPRSAGGGSHSCLVGGVSWFGLSTATLPHGIPIDESPAITQLITKASPTKTCCCLTVAHSTLDHIDEDDHPAYDWCSCRARIDYRLSFFAGLRGSFPFGDQATHFGACAQWQYGRRETVHRSQ
ncbi:hypothetical protein CfE428DRAFT_3975 [Chthoniobacter flavus Ellin428]|uniref:Uncharacterized protein n=1 Tax=Chthoniobacter flavus Ellin428 TaxID=497964 RepID=B4D4Y7_9BACT|nr:hypothetical protein CfE428DRAFT_3975 [Chthoniobacter flavus Ellin428]TCO90955.1 hypothetical protein EV701_109105 [Chthoniobacter flavus]